MFNHKSPTTLQAMADEVGRCAQEAVDAAQQESQAAMDAVQESTQHLKHQVNEFSDHVSRRATQYVKEDPLKSLMIAAASGAALMAVLSYLTRSRR
jgi:ElaB/YqjD/DUF883 family membrane-anchored ribosome-binding protein